jgi:hypothetical protein
VHVPDHGPCCMARDPEAAAGTDRKLVTLCA